MKILKSMHISIDIIPYIHMNIEYSYVHGSYLGIYICIFYTYHRYIPRYIESGSSQIPCYLLANAQFDRQKTFGGTCGGKYYFRSMPITTSFLGKTYAHLFGLNKFGLMT
jgi:hypothetical protein